MLPRVAVPLPVLLIAGALAVGVPIAIAADVVAPTANREPLAARKDPAGAKGYTLGLTRVVVPGGVALALHRHPGTQIAYIDKGTLTYTVRRGPAVKVWTGNAEKSPKLVRTIKAGQTNVIRQGEWIVETPAMVHFGANKGTKEVVILLSTLFRDGQPSAIPVTG
jgi:quercetin dioxygenase-like cupin family protein